MSVLANFGLQALTPSELLALAQPSAIRRFLSYIPLNNNIQGTAIVASGVTGAPYFVNNSYIGIPYTSGSAGMSSIPHNSTIWIGSAPLTHDVGIYRTRWDDNGASSPLNTMQISFSDVGLQPGITDNLSNFPGSIQAGQYITVLKSRNLWQAQERITLGPTTYYKDYDRAWGSDTIAPPAIVNIGPHRSVFVDSGQSYATLTFSITPIIWPGTTSATLSYTWTLPAGAVLVSGSLTGSITNQITGGTITVQFQVGWQVLKLSVTNTNIVSAYNLTLAERYIWVHDGSPYAPGPNFPPLPIGAINSDQRDMTSRTVQLRLLTQDSESLTEGAFVNVWTVPSFAGSSVPSLSTQCSGWITTAQFQSESGQMQTDLTIKNSGGVMQGIISKSNRIDIATTPANWQQVIPALGTVEYFIYYMLLYHVVNFLPLFDFWPWQDPLSNTYLGVGLTANAGNEMAQLQEIAKKAFLRFGTDSNGAAWIRPHPSEMLVALRNTNLIIRAAMFASMFEHIDWQQDYQQKVGSVQGEGFQYTGAIDPLSGQNIPTPLLARSPGALTGQGLSEQRLESQLVPDANTLLVITGLYYAELNNPLPKLNLSMPYNLDVFEPAQQNAFSMDLIGTLTPNGQTLQALGFLSGNWVPTQVNLADADGTTTVTVVAECQTYGVNGVSIPVPSPIVVPGGSTPPASWHAHIDFTLTQAGFTAVESSGTWTSGTGWQNTDFTSSLYYRGIWVALSLSSTTTITKMSFAGSLTIGGGTNYNISTVCGFTYTSNALLLAYLGSSLSSGAISKTWPDGSAYVNLSSPQNVNEIGVDLFCFASTVNSPSGSTLITTLDVYGTGTVPTELLPYIVP